MFEKNFFFELIILTKCLRKKILLWIGYLCHWVCIKCFSYSCSICTLSPMTKYWEKKSNNNLHRNTILYGIFTIFFWICFTSLSDYCILNNKQLYNNYLSYFGQKTLVKTQQVHNHHLIILGKGTHRQKTWIIILKRVVRQAHHLVFSRELRSPQGLNDLWSQYYTGCLIVIIVILSLWALCRGQDLTLWTETKNCFKMAVLIWQHLNPVD